VKVVEKKKKRTIPSFKENMEVVVWIDQLLINAIKNIDACSLSKLCHAISRHRQCCIPLLIFIP